MGGALRHIGADVSIEFGIGHFNVFFFGKEDGLWNDSVDKVVGQAVVLELVV